MRPPEIGAPVDVGDARVEAYDDGRLGRMYRVTVRLGFEDYQLHGAPYESFSEALAEARRVSRRERGERPDLAAPGEVDFQRDSQSWWRPDQRFDEPLPAPGLAGRIRMARRRIGWRPSI